MYYIYLSLLINGLLPFFILGAQRAPKNLHCPALYTKCRKKQMMLIWPMLEQYPTTWKKSLTFMMYTIICKKIDVLFSSVPMKKIIILMMLTFLSWFYFSFLHF